MQDKPSCEDCELTYQMYDEPPPCGYNRGTCEWLNNPPLLPENEQIQQVLNRYFQMPNVDIFRIMDAVGVEKDEQLRCFDQVAMIKNRYEAQRKAAVEAKRKK